MKRLSIGLFVLLLLQGSAQAQTHSERLEKLKKVLAIKIGKDMPGWSYRSVEPIEGSKNVIVDQWEAGNVIVRVAVNEYDTEESAFAALKKFKGTLQREEDVGISRGKTNFRLIKGDLPDLGDGGFIWDTSGSDAVAFKKKRFLAFVSVSRSWGHRDTVLSRLFSERVADAMTVE